MKLDQRLNLVIPVETAGRTYQVHSTPISMDAFKMHWKLIAKTYAQIFSGGYSAMSGPRIAAMLMQETSIEMETLRIPGQPLRTGTGDGFNQLMDEIRRNTMVIGGGHPLLLSEATGKGVIDETDRDTLENALVFFTVVSSMEKPAESAATMRIACSLWSGEMTSLNSTAFAGSLPTSTVKETTGENRVVVVSQVPS